MTDAEFTAVCGRIKSMIQDETPRDTGNLALNATRSESLGVNKVRIYVDTVGDHSPNSLDGIAPYFVYVNNEPFLRGRKNPNFGYWDNAIKRAIHNIAASYGGSVTIV